MFRTRTVLAWSLALLFLGLSFNAYACLVPLFAQPHAAMETGCPAPEDRPVRQFCDAFKALGVEAAPELYSAMDCQASCPDDTAPLSLFPDPSLRRLMADHAADDPPPDLMEKTCVLRL